MIPNPMLFQLYELFNKPVKVSASVRTSSLPTAAAPSPCNQPASTALLANLFMRCATSTTSPILIATLSPKSAPKNLATSSYSLTNTKNFASHLLSLAQTSSYIQKLSTELPLSSTSLLSNMILRTITAMNQSHYDTSSFTRPKRLESMIPTYLLSSGINALATPASTSSSNSELQTSTLQRIASIVP